MSRLDYATLLKNENRDKGETSGYNMIKADKSSKQSPWLMDSTRKETAIDFHKVKVKKVNKTGALLDDSHKQDMDRERKPFRRFTKKEQAEASQFSRQLEGYQDKAFGFKGFDKKNQAEATKTQKKLAAMKSKIGI